VKKDALFSAATEMSGLFFRCICICICEHRNFDSNIIPFLFSLSIFLGLAPRDNDNTLRLQESRRQRNLHKMDAQGV